MGNHEKAIDVDELLAALHAKKKWLDRAINVLESAVRSRDQRVIAGVLATYREAYAARSTDTLPSGCKPKTQRSASHFHRHRVRPTRSAR